MKLSKSTVNYHAAPRGSARRCGTCSMFIRDSPPRCTLVYGNIKPSDVCNRWERKKSRSTKG